MGQVPSSVIPEPLHIPYIIVTSKAGLLQAKPPDNLFPILFPIFPNLFQQPTVSKMRLPYMPATAPTTSSSSMSDPSTTAAYEQLSARRAPNPLLALDRALLHSPPVASGWSSFLGAIRQQTSLPTDIRELCICRVAVLNGATYEWEHHAPILKSEGKLSEEALEDVKERKAWQGWENAWGKDETGREEGDVGGALSERQRAVLAYADAMTIGIKVSDEIFALLRRSFDDRETVEITATVAAYNCVSRFLVALDVGEMSEKETK